MRGPWWRITAPEKRTVALAAVRGVSPPEAINPKQAAAIQQLQQLEQSTAADFDTDFLAEILKAHKASVSNFEEAAVRARDEEVQAFAKKMLPTLKAHLQKAEDLSPKDGPMRRRSRTTPLATCGIAMALRRPRWIRAAASTIPKSRLRSASRSWS